MKPYLSIIILNYNRKKDSLELIESLHEQTYKDFEIIFVDNNSNDGSAKAVEEKYPDVNIVSLAKNAGRAAHNKGADIAEGEIIVFLDADTYFPKYFLKTLSEKYKKLKDLDAAAFKMYDPQDPGRRWVPVHTKDGSREEGFESTFGGGLWSIRKEVFEDVGGFNPDFFVYVDELEYLIRMWKKGYSVRYFPDLIGYHKESPYAYRSIMRGYHVIINHAQIYALYLPIKLWPKFLKHHLGQTTEVLVKNKANRWGSIKGLLFAGFHFLKALPKRNVVEGKALDKLIRFYFPRKGDVVIEMWGWY